MQQIRKEDGEIKPDPKIYIKDSKSLSTFRGKDEVTLINHCSLDFL